MCHLIVGFLKTDKNARYQGYLFYFREGFCWINILNPQAKLLKAKLKQKTVNDVGSMSLSSHAYNVPNYYLVALLNSKLLFNYYRAYINNTVNIQINDIRQLPIIVPKQTELNEIKKLFDQLLKFKKNEFESGVSFEGKIKKTEQNIYNIIEKLYY